MALKGSDVACVVFADDDWRTAIEISCRDDAAVGGEDEHRHRAANLLVNVLDAVDEVLTLRDEQCHKLSRVGVAVTQLSEMLFVVEALLFQLLDVGDFRHRR